jgi:hypothetical protein
MSRKRYEPDLWQACHRANSWPNPHVDEMNPTMTRTTRSDWLIPAALIALSVVPSVAGTVRLAELSGGAGITAENARFFAEPVPVVAHILVVIPYCIVGAFQFAPAFRRRRRGWHRAAGRILAPLGLSAALTGLWMAHFYPWPIGDGEVLYILRLVFGSAMAVSILLGLRAIRRREYASHGAWMMRGYAIGLGAGTQVLTLLPWFVVVGKPGEAARAVLMGAGWVINVAIAEFIIRTGRARRSMLDGQRAAVHAAAGGVAVPLNALPSASTAARDRQVSVRDGTAP